MRTNTMKSCYLTLVAATCVVGQLSAQTLTDYQNEVMNQGPSNYFKLDGSLESAVNPGVVLTPQGVGGGFTADAFRNPTNAYGYLNNNDELGNFTDPLISGGGVANSNATSKGSITFLFRALDGLNIGGQRYLFDATTTGSMGTTNHNALSLWFENDTSTNNPNSLKLRFGDDTQVIMQPSNIVFSTWYYFALTYDEARLTNKAIWYLGVAGSPLSTGMTTNAADAVAGEGTGLFVGNRAAFNGAYRSPGVGRIDEFAIWARELSSTEVSNQFTKLPRRLPREPPTNRWSNPQIPKYYFKLDDSLAESVGNTLMLSTNGTNGAFTLDFLSNPDWAYSFSASDDALYITNDLINGGGPGRDDFANGTGTISFQFRMLEATTNTGQRWIFSAPGSETTSIDDNQLGLFLENDTASANPNSLKLRVGNTTKGNVGSSPIRPTMFRSPTPQTWFPTPGIILP